MKLRASDRLRAVTIQPGAYLDVDGAQDLVLVQKQFDRRHKFVGRNKDGLDFCWVKDTLACVDSGRVVGFIELRPGIEVLEVDGHDLKVRGIQSMFLDRAYRGRGLILGMHQYLITQFNLLSDDVYTPEGFKVWEQLKKAGHCVECVPISCHAYPNDWEDEYNVLLVRKGQ